METFYHIFEEAHIGVKKRFTSNLRKRRSPVQVERVKEGSWQQNRKKQLVEREIEWLTLEYQALFELCLDHHWLQTPVTTLIS